MLRRSLREKKEVDYRFYIKKRFTLKLKENKVYFINKVPYKIIINKSKNVYEVEHAILHYSKIISISNTDIIQEADEECIKDLEDIYDCREKYSILSKNGEHYNGELEWDSKGVTVYLWNKLLIHKYCTTLQASDDIQEINYEDIEEINGWSPQSWTPEDTPNCPSCMSSEDEDEE